MCSLLLCSNSASEPCLGLQIECKPFQESTEDWDDGAETDVDIMPSIRGLEALRLPQLQMQQIQGTGSQPHRVMSQHQQQNNQPSQSSGAKMQHRLLPGLILNQVCIFLVNCFGLLKKFKYSI